MRAMTAVAPIERGIDFGGLEYFANGTSLNDVLGTTHKMQNGLTTPRATAARPSRELQLRRD